MRGVSCSSSGAGLSQLQKDFFFLDVMLEVSLGVDISLLIFAGDHCFAGK